MQFAAPEFLWLILLLPLIGLAGWWSYARKKRALGRFAGGRNYVGRFTSHVSANRRAVKVMLVYCALLCTILALARPQLGIRMEEVTRQGVDLVVLLDTSLSMAAEDIAPNRFTLAKEAIGTLLDYLEGDRVALVTFAGRATVSCPLTLDHGAVRLFLGAVDLEAGPVSGTSLADALTVALRSFGDEQDDAAGRSRGILIFTDGEDHEGGMEVVLQQIEQSGVAVYTVGLGSNRGAPIPSGDGAYKKDGEGKVVTTRLDETILQQLALDTAGQYHRATIGQTEMQEIALSLSGLDTREFGAVLRARYSDRYQFPLALALLALLLETMLGDTRRPMRDVAPEQSKEAGQ
jgi:Ca-activated chloride channel family protein